VKGNITVAILVTLSTWVTLAEDFKTVNGKEYKDATVSHIEPDGIVLRTKSGISKVYFAELPEDVQERFLPSIPKTGVAQDALIKVKIWTASVKNPTSFLLLSIGVVGLIVAGAFAIVRGRHRPGLPIRRRL
jgi:hypothetical protein